MKKEDFVEGLYSFSELEKEAPPLEGVPTGVPGLDVLFFRLSTYEGEFKKIPLPGFPRFAVVHLTGVPDTGKSLVAEQFALTQAERGEKVLFVTVELPGPFLVQSIRERARSLGVPWEQVTKNILLVDAAKHFELREDVLALSSLIERVVSREKIRHVVIDSITGLYEGREMMARSIVRKLYHTVKSLYQTAVFVSQKRSSHEEISAEAAGGYAVPHIVDCTIVLSKFVVTTKQLSALYGKPVGDVVRTLRIDGCRICGHDTRTYLAEITEEGIFSLKGPLFQGKEG
ncbi:KaiC domain-containing protein [Candidatus Caldatribacterium sp.]|uniref:KaiC domain-containing protein n=1 Tax=Candidatus Caldatribacterium sp. TaxID=2282143 RepID=UPI0029971FE5|nr:KaiC domain-containing protein [Candidatus Calescibacterium sp.]